MFEDHVHVHQDDGGRCDGGLEQGHWHVLLTRFTRARSRRRVAVRKSPDQPTRNEPFGDQGPCDLVSRSQTQ
jgi:hypothetical protein